MIKDTILRDRSFKTLRARDTDGRDGIGSPVPFCSPSAKLSIGSLDEANLTVTAHYNPAEFSIGKSMPWNPKNEQNDPKAQTRSNQDSHEFKGTPSRQFSLELLFDNYETGESIKPIIDMLEKLSTVRSPESSDSEMRRPHYCVVAWGGGINIRCIIVSLNIRFTMFANDGTPLRAICNLELQEANLKSSFAGKVAMAGVDAVKAMGRAALEAANMVRG
jgi:hypothetical protein